MTQKRYAANTSFDRLLALRLPCSTATGTTAGSLGMPPYFYFEQAK